jgi:hypothetical protein
VWVLAAVSPSPRLRSRTTADINEFQNEPVLLLRQGFGTREMFDDACRIARVQPNVVLANMVHGWPLKATTRPPLTLNVSP